MDVFPLLLPLFMLPGVEALSPIDVYTDGEVVAFDQLPGSGRPVQPGDVATLHYDLSQVGGKQLADTDLRGLTYSVVVDGTLGLSPVVDALGGMRLGGTRVVLVPSNRLVPVDSSILPKDSELVLTLRLIALGKPRGPKVDSNDAGRTKGAVEIPRAPDRDGPARPKDSL